MGRKREHWWWWWGGDTTLTEGEGMHVEGSIKKKDVFGAAPSLLDRREYI